MDNKYLDYGGLELYTGYVRDHVARSISAEKIERQASEAEIMGYLDKKQRVLKAGSNITIIEGGDYDLISASGDVAPTE